MLAFIKLLCYILAEDLALIVMFTTGVGKPSLFTAMLYKILENVKNRINDWTDENGRMD